MDGSPTYVPNGSRDTEEPKKRLLQLTDKLYASRKVALLLIFQALDAAGKDGTVRKVMSAVSHPHGCRAHAFKAPSEEELTHDFLWRSYGALPGRGRVSIFNRSYYEEVLAVRLHPDYLGEWPATRAHLFDLWSMRYASINAFENHLASEGTVIMKFWLNVSQEEQRRRVLRRIDNPEKNWKFSEEDVKERANFQQYMAVYEETLRATSQPWAPWYAIPADDKKHMRAAILTLIADKLETLGLAYPRPTPEEQARMALMRDVLVREG